MKNTKNITSYCDINENSNVQNVQQLLICTLILMNELSKTIFLSSKPIIDQLSNAF